MKVNLQRRNVLVTGAAKRIGRQIALAVANNGGNVALHYFQSETEVQKTKAEVESYGVKVTTVQADLANYQEVGEMKAKLDTSFGPIDSIVNNAAWTQFKSFFQYEPEEWKREVDICFHGVLNLTHVFMPTMMERNQGKFINIVGDSARTGERNLIISAAARNGTISFLKSLAKEVGRNDIQCNTVSLGTIDHGHLREDIFNKIVKQYPLQRLGSPQDITGMILFLLSEDANWITGQVFSVNGGYSMIG